MNLSIAQMRQSLAQAVRGSLRDLFKVLEGILDGDLNIPVVLNAATVTLNYDTHANRPLVFSRAAGVTATLPAARGTGRSFEFFVATTVTSNALAVKAANASDVFQGRAVALQDGGDTLLGFETASDTDTVSMNGTTTGGIRGDRIRLTDIATNLWHVEVIMAGTSVEATPFSATVS